MRRGGYTYWNGCGCSSQLNPVKQSESNSDEWVYKIPSLPLNQEVNMTSKQLKNNLTALFILVAEIIIVVVFVRVLFF